jgi:uncharacterized protein with NRDE domain
MCLILFSYCQHPDYRLILAANRDEFYNRPTRALSYWDNAPSILAGRDVKGGGTWLGISRTGRFSAITNFREPGAKSPDAPSRGLLVSRYLSGQKSPASYLQDIDRIKDRYSGFNLLVGDRSSLFYYSNRNPGIHRLTSGINGLSNHLLDTDWPKIRKGKKRFRSMVEQNGEISISSLFEMMQDRVCPPDDQLPDTGVDIYWERLLSPLFVSGKRYGTRSTSIIMVTRSGEVRFVESTFNPKTPGGFDTTSEDFRFLIPPDVDG